MALPSQDVNNAFHVFKNVFTYFHLNVWSLRNKKDELSVLLDEFVFSFDMIMLTEAWYSSNTDIFKQKGYQSFFLNRPNNQGGGLEMLAKIKL